MSRLSELQRQFAGHIRNPGETPAPDDIEDRRMAIYRELFFNNIQGFIANNFPVLRKLYTKQRWHDLVRDFFVRHRAHTPLFPELPREFLQFVQDHRGPEQGDPPFILELAHYEWAELALSLDEAEQSDVAADPHGDLIAGVPVLSPLAWLLSYEYPVHLIKPEFQPDSPPDEPTHLVIYRRSDDKVRFLKLNAVTARLLQLLQQDPGQTGRGYLELIAGELGAENAEAIVQAGTGILADLAKREVILGTAPAS
ncbi:MAG: putative DNA-binding domain-containing protein [Pseudomonadota bacterium]